ncbi:hypothetical protein QW060_21895 [Myroides ceti]|uniref:Uncharacterized protein n=1 Tax=Paenimyroides ceti TaxID=395087 RepID=A0ABT8CZF2_9FLAO|nr:hypothetical protein [Paenimyroides ceti]MDN3709620.1 hypothetical protein [Paenimyroides ceti]
MIQIYSLDLKGEMPKFIILNFRNTYYISILQQFIFFIKIKRAILKGWLF